MPWLIVVLAIALAVAGGASVVHGYPYMQLEFGWTEVIAGTTAVAAGVVTFALATVLFSLAALRRSVERGGRMPLQAAAPPLSGREATMPPAPVDGLADSRSIQDPEPAEARRPDGLRERLAAKSAPALRATRTPPSVEIPAPSVAGRYESGGSSYVLFTDGTIEVESEIGKHRFGSMEDLKSFMGQVRPDGVEAQSGR